jgi:hypothetical protein
LAHEAPPSPGAAWHGRNEEGRSVKVVRARKIRAHPRRISLAPVPGRTQFPPAGTTHARVHPQGATVMNSVALLTFVLIGGLVWGGLALIIATAMRKESRKAGEG